MKLFVDICNPSYVIGHIYIYKKDIAQVKEIWQLLPRFLIFFFSKL